MCFLRFSKGKGVDDSDLYYFKDKGSIKSTSKLEALGRTLLSGAIGWILTKFAHFTSISGPRVAPKENSLKKFAEANFSNLVPYLLYTYSKKSTEKLWGKSILWAKLDMRILQRLALNIMSSVNCLRTYLHLTQSSWLIFLGHDWKHNSCVNNKMNEQSAFKKRPFRKQNSLVLLLMERPREFELIKRNFISHFSIGSKSTRDKEGGRLVTIKLKQ